MSTLSRSFDRVFGTDAMFSPVWSLRIGSLIGCLSLLLGEAVFLRGFVHGFCIGLAFAQFGIIATSSFRISSMELKRDPRDPQQLGLTS